jgi:hypothetical protein
MTESSRKAPRWTLLFGVVAIAIGYASAFMTGGPPAWGSWMLGTGIPAALVGIMSMGAARGPKGLGPLRIPLLFVLVVLAAGFCLALALPSTEAANMRLVLGLPLRAAIVIYGVGLLPIFVLPIAYALTFHTQTLNESDIERVRELAKARVEETTA